MKARVSTKGQVTIPGRIREHLGIRPGTVVEFVEEPGRVVLVKAADDDPIDSLIGILGEGGNTDAIIEELRGPGLGG